MDVISDIAQLPFATETFDVVLCTEVLEHVPEPTRAVKEMVRVLRGGSSTFRSPPIWLASRAVSLLWRFYTLLV